MLLTNNFSYDTLHTKSKDTSVANKINANMRKEVWIMDMFSFLNNGILLCMLNANKDTEKEDDEYDYWFMQSQITAAPVTDIRT